MITHVFQFFKRLNNIPSSLLPSNRLFYHFRAMSVTPHHQRHVSRIHAPSGLEFREKLRSRHITDFQSLSGEDAVRHARMKERGIGPYRGGKAGTDE